MIRSIQDATERKAELDALREVADRTCDYDEYDAHYYDTLHSFAISVAEGGLVPALAPRVARILTGHELGGAA